LTKKIDNNKDEADAKLSELESENGILEAKTIISRNTNLINEDSLYFTKGFYLDNNGNKVASSTFMVTGFIPVEDGKTYYFDASHPTNSNRATMRFVTAYDENGLVLADKGQNNSGVARSYICPEGVAFIRISTYSDVTNVVLTTIKGASEPFKPLSVSYLNDRLAVVEKTLDDSEKYKGFHKVPNKVFRLLGNTNGMQTDSVCKWDGDSVIIKPIDDNGIRYEAMIFQYDANFNELKYNNLWASTYEETRMENAVYFDIRIAKKVNGSYAVITESDLETLTIYINDEQSLPYDTGKTINMLGDSITAEGNVVKALKKYGYKVNNYGVSGTAICRGSDAFIKRYSSMTDDCDIVLVLGGVNDWRTGTAGLGAFEDGAGEWDFYQALHTLMLGLKDKYLNQDSNKKVYICTPLHNHFIRNGAEDLTEFSYDGNKIIANKNTHNGEPYHTFKEYVIAEKEVAEFYGLPVIDTYSESGFAPIQELNRTTYTNDGLHPNVAGGKLIADCIIRYL
jgi:lysophospholipase L1-like esterase